MAKPTKSVPAGDVSTASPSVSEKKPSKSKRRKTVRQKFKECTACGRTKAPSLFGKNSKTKDGLQPQCKDCTNAKQRAIRVAAKSGKSAAKATSKKAKATSSFRSDRGTNYVQQIAEQLKPHIDAAVAAGFDRILSKVLRGAK